MPARIVVAHDDPFVREPVVTALTRAEYDVAVFADPMAALNDIDDQTNALITEMRFPPGHPNGVSLARMALAKRPGLRVLLTAQAQFRKYADGLGVFLPAPLDPARTVATVGHMLAAYRVVAKKRPSGQTVWVVVVVEPDGQERPMISFNVEARARQLVESLNAREAKQRG
jgi:DNA-binding NtrC family response regulator